MPVASNSALKLHHSEQRAQIEQISTTTQHEKDTYRRNFSEAWYGEMCAKWNMNDYQWDIEEFRYNEKQVSGDYSYLNEIDLNDTEKLSLAYKACSRFLSSCQ